MAHELTIRLDGKAEMAYVGETPWHGLGQQLDPNAGIDDWRKAAGLDWSIQRSSVLYKQPNKSAVSTFTGQEVLFRSDNGEPLSIVSERYHEVQPAQVLEFFRDLVDTQGYKLHTAGTLKGGRRIWALAETNKAAEITPDDGIGGFLLLATSCDRGMATSARFTSIRVVCANTLAIAEREMANSIFVRHNTKFDATKVKDELGVQVSQWERFIGDARYLATKECYGTKPDQYLKALFEPTSYRLKTDANFKIEDSRAYKSVLDLFHGAGMGSQLNGSRGTYWGMVNAVTEFIDHHSFKRSADARLNEAWFGTGDKLKTRALELALSA